MSQVMIFHRILSFMVLASVLFSWAPQCHGGPEEETRKDGAPGSAPDPTRNPQFHQRNPRYQIRPADVIEITFYPAAEFNQTLTVQPDGYISLRETGDLFVQGKSVPELQQAIGSAYATILNNPVVTVTLKDFEKPHIIVGGQVGHPGKYELRADTTVNEAVALAGGLTEKAKHSQVLLFRRVSNDWVEIKDVDLKSIQKGRMQEDIHLHPGDMVFVPQNRISKIKP